MKIKYLTERLEAVFGDQEDWDKEDYKECLDMLYEMTIAFAKADHNAFTLFYYSDYLLPAEKRSKKRQR